MPEKLNILLISKLFLWLVVVIVSAFLLKKKMVNPKLRIGYLIGGMLLFGVVYGIEPNPVLGVRNFLNMIFVKGQILPAILIMLFLLLLVSWINNKSICGWACQFGMLLDLLYRIPVPKFKIPFILSLIIRGVSFVVISLFFVFTGIDILGLGDPFSIFRLSFPTIYAVIFVVLIIFASFFTWRPFCHLFCPFGFLSWIFEQISIMKPRIDWEKCKKCKACVKTCPGSAMLSIYNKKRIRSDCFACGACIYTCKFEALKWRQNIRPLKISPTNYPKTSL